MNNFLLCVSIFSLLNCSYAQADGVRVGDYFPDEVLGRSATPYIKRIGAEKLREEVGDQESGKAIVIDNYVDPTHSALVGNLTDSIIPGQYEPGMSPSHGTFTTGIIHNLATVVDLKFIARYEQGANGKYYRDEGTVVRAIQKAARSSGDVVNMSFGLGPISSRTIEALQEVVDSGKVIFLAFGNGGGKNKAYLNSLIKCVNDPRLKGRVILVGNLQYDKLGRERLSSSSDYVTSKTEHAICAPGTDILSTAAGGSYTIASGTSAAAPVATGAYLLLKKALPSLTPDQYLRLLKDSARRQSMNESYIFGAEYGNGALDLDRAYKLGVARYGQKVKTSRSDSEVKTDEFGIQTKVPKQNSAQIWFSWAKEKANDFNTNYLKPAQRAFSWLQQHPIVQKQKNNIQRHVTGLVKAASQSVKSAFSSWMGW